MKHIQGRLADGDEEVERSFGPLDMDTVIATRGERPSGAMSRAGSSEMTTFSEDVQQAIVFAPENLRSNDIIMSGVDASDRA